MFQEIQPDTNINLVFLSTTPVPAAPSETKPLQKLVLIEKIFVNNQ
jgi:hypothetical protein